MLNQVRTLLCGEKEVIDKHKINQELECFYKNLFTENSEFQKEDINAYLSKINISILTEEQSQTCEGPITEPELLNAIKSIPNNKSPGNDGLTNQFYETFWEEIKIPLCNSITKSYQNGELKTSQRQAVIKLIEKKDKDKKIIKNWRPISLLNVDTKLISNVLAERLVNINGLDIFEYIFLHTAYADDTTFFLKDEKSVIELIKTFDIFSTFSGLKRNKNMK